MVRRHKTEIRVRFDETDALGVVYYANYFKYFGIGSFDLLGSLGYKPDRAGIAIAEGVSFPRGEAYCHYDSPARYGEELLLYTGIGKLTQSTITFDFELVRRVGREVVARGSVSCVAVETGEQGQKEWKVVALPTDLISRLVKEGYLAEQRSQKRQDASRNTLRVVGLVRSLNHSLLVAS